MVARMVVVLEAVLLGWVLVLCWQYLPPAVALAESTNLALSQNMKIAIFVAKACANPQVVWLPAVLLAVAPLMTLTRREPSLGVLLLNLLTAVPLVAALVVLHAGPMEMMADLNGRFGGTAPGPLTVYHMGELGEVQSALLLTVEPDGIDANPVRLQAGASTPLTLHVKNSGSRVLSPRLGHPLLFAYNTKTGSTESLDCRWASGSTPELQVAPNQTVDLKCSFQAPPAGTWDLTLRVPLFLTSDEVTALSHDMVAQSH